MGRDAAHIDGRRIGMRRTLREADGSAVADKARTADARPAFAVDGASNDTAHADTIVAVSRIGNGCGIAAPADSSLVVPYNTADKGITRGGSGIGNDGRSSIGIAVQRDIALFPADNARHATMPPDGS